MKSAQLKIHEQMFDEQVSKGVVKCDSTLYRQNRCNSTAPGAAQKTAGQSTIGSRARERRGLSSRIPKAL